MLKAILAAGGSYHNLESDDFNALEQDGADHDAPLVAAPTPRIASSSLPRASYGEIDTSANTDEHRHPQLPDVPVRIISRANSAALRHPTPDLQSIQGAYVGNVERLEQSAERLSISSDIGEEVRKMREGQKRKDSRRSSVMASRQFSSSSQTSGSILQLNSVARLGGFSPEAYVTSPAESLQSPAWSIVNSRDRESHGHRLSRMSEPEQEGRPLSSLPKVSPTIDYSNEELRHNARDGTYITSANSVPFHDARSPMFEEHDVLLSQQDLLDLPEDSTNRDADVNTPDPFADFDGVHQDQDITPTEGDRDLTSSPFSPHPNVWENRTQTYILPPDRPDDMVYYPAPVPMMLNLPQKLSKVTSASERQRRRSQVLSAMPYANARRSTAGLPVQHEQPHVGVRQSAINLPAQLRASVFFEHPSIQHDIQIKGGSAVATLDSILDASAHAPVSAFTDHPFAGHMGSEVYGKANGRASVMGNLTTNSNSEKRISSLNLLARRKSGIMDIHDTETSEHVLGVDSRMEHKQSSGMQLADYAALEESGVAHPHRGHSPLQHSGHNLDGGEEEYEVLESGYNHDELGNPVDQELYTGIPTTLLAELQLRKQEQKQRTRTAATAFPNGMHSTLMELDAVAQVQKRSRGQKRITLAWEGPEAQQSGGSEDDEDIPLAMLFPGRAVVARDGPARFDDEQPLGLIAKRAVDDNEPLGKRKERLQNEQMLQAKERHDKRASMFTLEVPGLTDIKDDTSVNEENETLAQRIQRLRDAKDPTKRRISTAFATELMTQFGGLSVAPGEPNADLVDQEETLGQRRKRLQAERLSSGNHVVDTNSVPQSLQKRHTSDSFLAQPWEKTYVAPLASGLGYHNAGPNAGNMNPAGFYGPGRTITYNNPMTYQNPMAYNPNGMGLGHTNQLQNRPPNGFQTPQEMEQDQKRREMIDRWRQSVMH